MKENKNCILLKSKEYDNLVARAEANKPDYIKVNYSIDYYRNGSVRYYCPVEANFNLTYNLEKQISNIGKLMSEKIIKEIDIQSEATEIAAKTDLINKLKLMSFWELRKWLKSK